jgi:hypothetical protein
LNSFVDPVTGLRDFRPTIGDIPITEPVAIRVWRGLRYVALVLAWALFAVVVLHR